MGEGLEELKGYLRESYNLEDIIFNERRDQGVFLFSIDKNTGEDVDILITNTNKVFLNGKEQEGLSPVSVWTLDV